jgi:hypothetical protein
VDSKKMAKDAKLTEFLKKALEYHMQLSSLWAKLTDQGHM